MTSSIAELNELLTTLSNMRAERDGLLQEAQDLEDVAAKARDDAQAAKKRAAALEATINILAKADDAIQEVLTNVHEQEKTFLREIYDSTADDDTITRITKRAKEIGYDIDQEADQEAQPVDAGEEQAELDLSTQAA
jgi:chromosome segregation ATPase